MKVTGQISKNFKGPDSVVFQIVLNGSLHWCPFYYTLVSAGIMLSLGNLKKTKIVSNCYYDMQFSITIVAEYFFSRVSLDLFIFKFLNFFCLFITDLMFSLSICMSYFY